MRKKIATVYVYRNDIDDISSLDELLEILNEAKENGGKDVDISSEYESSTVEISISYGREETDEECLQREEKENKAREQSLVYKRRELERLKKELGEI